MVLSVPDNVNELVTVNVLADVIDNSPALQAGIPAAIVKTALVDPIPSFDNVFAADE